MNRHLTLLCTLLLLSLSSFCQGWRLSKEIYHHPDGIMLTEYSYDSKGNISRVSYKQGKKLLYTESNFKTDPRNKLLGFVRNYANGMTPKETYTIQYNAGGQLQKLTQTILKDGNEKFSLSKEYQWSDKVVNVTETRASFAGNLTRLTRYTLNDEKNILKIEYLDKDGKENASPFIFSGYDSHINPQTLLGNYTNGDIISVNNKLDEGMGDRPAAKLSYLYNKDGLPTESKTTYTFADSGPVVHKTQYQYVTITGMAMGSNKSQQIPPTIREKAVAQKLTQISICLYNNDTVYLLTKKTVAQNRSVLNIEDRYYTGSGVLVKSNVYTQFWNLPRKDHQTIPELKIIQL